MLIFLIYYLKHTHNYEAYEEMTEPTQRMMLFNKWIYMSQMPCVDLFSTPIGPKTRSSWTCKLNNPRKDTKTHDGNSNENATKQKV